MTNFEKTNHKIKKYVDNSDNSIVADIELYKHMAIVNKENIYTLNSIFKQTLKLQLIFRIGTIDVTNGKVTESSTIAYSEKFKLSNSIFKVVLDNKLYEYSIIKYYPDGEVLYDGPYNFTSEFIVDKSASNYRVCISNGMTLNDDIDVKSLSDMYIFFDVATASESYNPELGSSGASTIVGKSLPLASEQYRGRFFTVQSDISDELYYCKLIDGKYRWYHIDIDDERLEDDDTINGGTAFE